MTIERAIRDYQGSYMLGEADGEHWSASAHANEIQSIALLDVEDVGGFDIFNRKAASWLGERAAEYQKRDQRFDTAGYIDGFLTAVRKIRSRQTQAAAVAAKGIKR
jgi:hypothetical protein